MQDMECWIAGDGCVSGLVLLFFTMSGILIKTFMLAHIPVFKNEVW